MKPAESTPKKKFSLRTTLVTPFVLQIVTAVGLVGYLSFRNGQQAVSNLAIQLSSQVSDRVSQQLSNYLATPRQANELTLQAIELGMLSPKDFDTTGRFFWKQMTLSENLSYMNFGSQQGDFIGVGREDDGSLYTERMRQFDRNRYKRYAMDQQGNPTTLLATELYLYQQDEWYKSAVATGKPLWSPIYQWEDRPDIISISCSYPIYDRSQQLVGVLGIDFILSQISDFLRKLQVSPSGKVFIIEQNGLIVASSSPEKPYVQVGGKAQRKNVLQSQEPLVQQVAQQLRDRFGTFDKITTPQLLKLDLQGAHAFVSVTPWQDALGLNWLVVVAIPEVDFMQQINANTRNTILLCLASLITAIAIGILTTRWITRPILQISHASDQLAQGNLDQQVTPSAIAEIGTLATSFNRMAGQLKGSFDALRHSEATNRAIVNTIPDLMIRAQGNGIYLDIAGSDHLNVYAVRQFGPGSSVQESLPPELAARRMHYIQQALTTGELQVYEHRLTLNDDPQDEEVRIMVLGEDEVLIMVRDITARKQAEEALRLANEELEQRVERRTAELRKEKERSEQLLLNILPAEIAERLKQTNASPAEHFEEVTILFADIVGFTSLSARMEPMQLVSGLNQIFSAFDHLTETYGLEKIKTIGDAYMVVGGLPIPHADHAAAIANIALDMQAHMQTLDSVLGESLQIRIGINTGPVIAGVIGIKKFIYDLWGDAVNLASRMESHGEPGGIQVTEATYVRLKDQFLLEPRGTISVKGRGEMMTYWLVGRQTTTIAPTQEFRD